jgi:hypothetical protein
MTSTLVTRPRREVGVGRARVRVGVRRRTIGGWLGGGNGQYWCRDEDVERRGYRPSSFFTRPLKAPEPLALAIDGQSDNLFFADVEGQTGKDGLLPAFIYRNT